MSLFASLHSQSGCTLSRISFHHLYCYYILNKQNHFLCGKCQSYCNHIVCVSERGCPCDLHSFLPSLFLNGSLLSTPWEAQQSLLVKLSFSATRKRHRQLICFPFHSEHILNILWQKLLVWFKKNLV